MRTGKVKRLLISPLDWGLGHTTRCIPLIRYVRNMGHEVVVAGDARQERFIRAIFPNIEVWRLEGYNVQYSRRKQTFLPVLAAQLPRLARVIAREQAWLRQQVQRTPVDGIISDNRYGLYHDTIPSVILTHQLQVITGLGRYADQCARRIHYRFLDRFAEVWVPDLPDLPNVSGALGHPSVMPAQFKYIGLLSQHMAPRRVAPGQHLLFLLSGPEPQRGILSDMLWQQALNYKEQIVFVEGSEQAPTRRHIPPHINWHGRLTPDELHALISDATCVVSRSGYSTLMDLLALGKKAILIPTPGQTEQQYLGHNLHRQGLFYCAPQQGFSLEEALQQARSNWAPAHFSTEAFAMYQPVLSAWLDTL